MCRWDFAWGLFQLGIAGKYDARVEGEEEGGKKDTCGYGDIHEINDLRARGR